MLPTILTAPLELVGNWRELAAQDAGAVIALMRAACLEGIELRSDRQPTAMRVDDHSSGPPAIWLHTDIPTTAWIIVDVGTRDWCNLAYQFGHELGHVLANSWTRDAAPRNPTQWLEEAVVEAFSLRGLGKLADRWEASPPFPHDHAYAGAIREYRAKLLAPDQEVAAGQGAETDFAAWFQRQSAGFAEHGGVDTAKPAVPAMLRLLEADDGTVGDIGAMNRWPERTSLAAPDYLKRWQASCVELGLPGTLPAQITALLNGSR